jgi:hypothetical protein
MLGCYLEIILLFSMYGFDGRFDEVFLKHHYKFLSNFGASWEKEAGMATWRKV